MALIDTQVKSRLDLSGAKAVFTQDVVVRGGKALPLYARVADSGAAAAAIVLPANPGRPLQLTSPFRPGDVAWDAFLAAAPRTSPSGYRFEEVAHVADAYEPTNVLFSSGTTGEPKAIVWTHVTPLRCATDGYFNQVSLAWGSLVICCSISLVPGCQCSLASLNHV